LCPDGHRTSAPRSGVARAGQHHQDEPGSPGRVGSPRERRTSWTPNDEIDDQQHPQQRVVGNTSVPNDISANYKANWRSIEPPAVFTLPVSPNLSRIDGATNNMWPHPRRRGPVAVAVNESSNCIYVANVLDKTVMVGTAQPRESSRS
jgi:hypothetical protein